MRITNASNFRKNIFNYLSQTVDTNETIAITTKTGTAMLISEQEYNSLKETLYLTSIPGMTKTIIEGINTPTEQLIEVNWKDELQD